MNMPAYSIAQGFDRFIEEELAMVSELNQQRLQEMMNYSKSFLDRAFPLAKGSHKDVTNYVVYFQHLLAFFADGTQSGLAEPKQFVALSGHKSEPSSILLKQQDCHVEIIFNTNGDCGKRDAANIDDVQIQTQTSPSQSNQWFSMLKGDTQNMADDSIAMSAFSVSKVFTDKNGEDYILA